MLPDQLAQTNSEHAHQRAFFAWVNLAMRYGFDETYRICEGYAGLFPKEGLEIPELGLFHAIPNGGSRDKREVGNLKAEGVKAGVLDTFLPVPKTYQYPGGEAIYPGLYIEFKAPDKATVRDGGLSQAQLDFTALVQTQGYCARVAYSWREAANLVMLYYNVVVRFDTETRAELPHD